MISTSIPVLKLHALGPSPASNGNDGPCCCRDALHGWGQVILSVNVSPVSKDYDETAHVLKARSAGNGPWAIVVWWSTEDQGAGTAAGCSVLLALL